MTMVLNRILKVGFVREALKMDPVVLVDVGARAGVHERWARLEPFLKVVGFEPDKTECDRLNAGLKSRGNERHRFLATALSDRTGQRSLHLTKNPGCTSMLEPNAAFLSRFPESDRFGIARTVDVPVDMLDNVLDPLEIVPDFAKLDVQGAEMEVLNGSEKALESLFGLEIEVEFAELYKGQPLFANVDQFMRSKGFALFDLKRCWWKRKGGEETSNHRGQLIFGDALYFKDPVVALKSGQKMSRSRFFKYIVIALLYEKNDLVIELIQLGKEQFLLTESEATVLRSRVLSTRTLLERLPNIRGRYRLARMFQRFSIAVAPKSWGPSDILF